MFFKTSSLFFMLLISSFASQEKLTLYSGMFENLVYEGEIQNGKLNGKGIIYCNKSDKIQFKGDFVNNDVVSGIINSCEEFSAREIDFGIYDKIKYGKNSNPYFDLTITGNFVSDKKNISSLFNRDKDIVMYFHNTQSYDKFIGKTGINKYDAVFVDGTLYLNNNKIKEIKTQFYIPKLNFHGSEITIKGSDFTLEGFVEKDDNINNFTFDGVVRWNDGYEYYITKTKFKKDLFEKLESFKKLALPSKNKVTQKSNDILDLKNEKNINQNKEININVSDVQFKNNKEYMDKNASTNLEER